MPSKNDMIDLQKEEMTMFESILLILLAITVGFLVGHQLGMNWKIGRTEKKISLYVYTKANHRYKANTYRMGLFGPEVRLYNTHSNNLEWWSVFDLENPIAIVCQCDPEYAVQRWGAVAKDLTNTLNSSYNKTVKNEKRSD